jgi:hypothetical protein
MKIAALRENHKNKWLAIRVSKFSREKIPLEGELIAEADNREELWKKVPRDRKKAIYVMFTGDFLEEGYAAAF